VLVEEVLPRLVTAEFHPFDFGRLESVHGHGPDEGDVHTEGSVDAGAGQAEEDAELRGGLQRNNTSACEIRFCLVGVAVHMYPLRTGRTTVHAATVLIGLRNGLQLAPRLGIDLPHLAAHCGGCLRCFVCRRCRGARRVISRGVGTGLVPSQC
jgi:hypothetical protein